MNVIATTATGGNGAYDFSGLAAATYHVQVTDIQGHLLGLALSTPPNPSNPIVLGVGQDYDLADFGYEPPGLGTIGDQVWHDLDGDGFRGPDEPGVERVWLGLWQDVNSNGTLEPNVDILEHKTKTDRDGRYLFTNVPYGDWVVTVHDDENVVAIMAKTNGVTDVNDNSQPDPYDITLTPTGLRRF